MSVISFVSSITPISGVTVFAYWSGSKFVRQIQFFDHSGEIASKQKLRHCLATWAQVFVFTVYKTSYEHSLFQRETEKESSCEAWPSMDAISAVFGGMLSTRNHHCVFH